MAPILIVDDDATIREMFARALASIGEVEQAADGGEALRLLATKKYGALLLDLHMPMIDGFMVLHALSAKPGPNRDTPVLVVTADLSESARARALGRHAVFLLTKPVSIGTMKALVQNALARTGVRDGGSVAPEHQRGPSPSSRPPPPKKPLR
jgi:CheY-like chemotaxis protein